MQPQSYNRSSNIILQYVFYRPDAIPQQSKGQKVKHVHS